MKGRLLTGLLLIPALGLVLAAPWPWLFFVALAFGALMVEREILRWSPDLPVSARAAVYAVTVGVMAFWAAASYAPRLVPAWGAVAAAAVFAVFLAVAFAQIARKEFGSTLSQMGIALLAFVWGGLGTGALGMLRWMQEPKQGLVTLLFCILTCIAYDTGAYFGGTWFGKGNRIGLAVSPNKTWAGLAAGLAFAALVLSAFAAVVAAVSPATFAASWVRASWVPPTAALLLALVAQGGDLVESAMKRSAGVKDSGRLLGPHGGMFDRIDSWIAAGVVVMLVQFAVVPLWKTLFP